MLRAQKKSCRFPPGSADLHPLVQNPKRGVTLQKDFQGLIAASGKSVQKHVRFKDSRKSAHTTTWCLPWTSPAWEAKLIRPLHSY